MSREILFKAKSINTGQWEQSMTLAKGTIKRKAHCTYLEISENKYVGVIPETVSQFTGLSDKDGTKVFEGDEFDYKDEVRYVQYLHDKCRYVLTNGNGFDTRNSIDLDCDVIHGLKIIGNYHD
jgi:hypothetical protein